MIGIFRARAYKRLFLNDDGTLKDEAIVVLGDLERFCYGTSSTFDTEQKIQDLKEGRRETFLRIMGALKFDFNKYYEIKEEAENDRTANPDEY